LLKSLSAISVGQFVNILGNVLLVPLFLSRWSIGLYGEWMALSAVVAYFSITDLGMNFASANLMTAAYARGDLGRYRYLQGSAMAFYVSMALVASLLFGVLIMVLPIPFWIGIRLIPASTAIWVAWLLAARMLWQMPAAQVGSIYRTFGNLAATQWFGNLQSLGLLAVTLMVLLLHGGVFDLALWGAAPMLVVTLIAWWSLRRSHAELLPRLSEARRAGVRELLRPSLMFGLIIVSVMLTTQGPVLLVSGTLGGAAVTLLVITRTPVNVIRQVIGALAGALWPELTRLDAIGETEALRFNHRVLAIGSTMLCAAFAGALWFEGAGVIAVWTRGRLTPDIWLLRLFLIALVLQAPWSAAGLFTVTSNRHRNVSYSYAASAVLTIVAIAVLIRRCGLLAVPVGILFGDAVACHHFVIKDTCHVLKEDYPRYAVRFWSGFAAVCLAAWGAAWLGHSIAFGPAPLRWLEVGGLTTIAAVSVAWHVALRENDRSRLACWSKVRWSHFRSGGMQLPV
jgi:O-antigen/teichoic acid export membrane protein